MPRIDYIDDSEKTPQIAAMIESAKKTGAPDHRGAATIKSRLCSVGGFDPDEWHLPPKPKWMRWRTYNRMIERFDRYEVMGEEGLLKALARCGLPLG